jgi:uncharacterized membrane protein YecN with MAPEG domain
MEWIAIVTGLALAEYMALTMIVGLNREKYGVAVPATTGNEIWERHFRVQQNTVEQLVVFLPALWVFGSFTSAPIGAGLGLLFVVGRALYAIGYVADPSKRATGFMLGFLANVALVIGGIGGAISSFF